MRLMLFAGLPHKALSNTKKASKHETTKHSGMSFFRFCLVKTMGEIRTVMPKINKELNILEPATLPMVMSALPLMAANKLTTNSGMDVPMPTIVAPMTNSDRPLRFATATEPSTNQLAPKSTKSIPAINSRISIN